MIGEAELRRNSSNYLKLVLNKDRENALRFITSLAESQDYSLLEVLEILARSQTDIGNMWQKGSITIADEHFATETTIEGIDLVSRKKKRFIQQKKGTALLANFVEGEFHDLGLKMFAELLKSEGWEVEQYKSRPTVAEIFKHIERSKKSFDLICISLTMSFNISELQSVLKIIRTNLLTKNSKVLVGSHLFKSKRLRESLVDKETELPLADKLATDFEEGLEFARAVRT